MFSFKRGRSLSRRSGGSPCRSSSVVFFVCVESPGRRISTFVFFNSSIASPFFSSLAVQHTFSTALTRLTAADSTPPQPVEKMPTYVKSIDDSTLQSSSVTRFRMPQRLHRIWLLSYTRYRPTHVFFHVPRSIIRLPLADVLFCR